MTTEDYLRYSGSSRPDPSERRIAAEALGTADEGALYPLIAALRDQKRGAM